MKTTLALIAALVVSAFAFAGTSAAAPCQASLTASVNPSAVGEEVTFDTGCLAERANVIYTVGMVNLDTGETVQVVVTGDFAYTFDSAGDYFLHLFQQRNGKQVLSLAYANQTVE